MLGIHIIRSNKEDVANSLRKRNWPEDQLGLLDEIIALDDKRKSVQAAKDGLLADRNRMSKEIGGLFKEGKVEEANAMKEKVSQLKSRLDELQTEEEQVATELRDSLVRVPNLAHESVPPGKTDEDNVLVKGWDKPLPQLGDWAQPHWELAEKYNLIDFKTGVELSGSGFALFRGRGARLERAMISYFLDRAVDAGYEEIMPPLLVNEQTAFATGQLPDKEGQMYYVEKDNLYLIPTAEVPITNVMRGQILKEGELPVKLTGYTPCFRREAGSYGSDVKGLNRVHQFDKVEIVQVTHPDKSYDTLQEMVDHAASILDDLGLPYRIVRLCGGDLGFAAALTYDFEVYSAGQDKWLEVSSVSNFETFQTNRLQLRYKDEQGKNRLAHTLNGSALALARIMATILENYQTEDGIEVPEVLRPYTGFDRIS